MKVAVTGITGIVGRFIAARLLQEGVDVHALVRPSSDRDGLAEVHWHEGDLTDVAATCRLVDEADAVVHCAFQHEPGRYRGGEGNDRIGFWRTNLLASLELMERGRWASVGRLVLISSRAVFGGDSPEGPVTEETRPVPDTHYGALKLALEAHASAFAHADGLCCVSLRPTGVYGLTHPVQRSKWFDLAEAVASGAILPPARLGTEVHGEGVAAAVWLLLTAPADQVAGRSFNCSDLLVDTRDVMKRLGERFGRPVEVPPASNVVRHPMSSAALQALGWRPGGRELLMRTIDDLAAAVLASAKASRKL